MSLYTKVKSFILDRECCHPLPDKRKKTPYFEVDKQITRFGKIWNIKADADDIEVFVKNEFAVTINMQHMHVRHIKL